MIKSKNIIKISILVVVMLFALNGCVSVNLNSLGEQESIEGKGEMITKEFSVSEYNAVKIEANMAIVYTAAASDVVKVESQKNLLECLDISVVNSQLIVKSNKDFITSDNRTPVIYISTPSLNELVVEGMVQLKESASVQSSELHLVIDGSLDGSLAVDTQNLSIDFNGIGDITLSGKAAQTDISVDGAGNLNALDLKTENSSIQLDGTGNISLSCSDTLDIQIDGAGTVNYRGTPSLQQDISGVGSINQVD